MAASAKHRNAIVNTAAMLFRRQGFAATGINEIADGSGAPKGSLYHYFPKGKDQIGEAAVRFAGSRVTRTFQQLYESHKTASAMVKAYGRMLAGWMAESGFRDGCPITTTLLESAPASAAITAAGRDTLDAWRAIMTRALIRDGFARARAQKLARLTIAAIGGALVQARVERSAKPIHDVFDALAESLRLDAKARSSGKSLKRAAS